MPYRIDLPDSSPERLNEAMEVLVVLGALDIDTTSGGLAALMPDGVPSERVCRELGLDTVNVSAAAGRDNDSVWFLSPRPVRIGTLLVVPAHLPSAPGALRLSDSTAFGTGLHATTALCIEMLDEVLDDGLPEAVLDIGTGSGVLALAALLKGVPRATGVDIDPQALQVAAGNARINNLDTRLQLVHGSTEDVRGMWPLVFANILAAPLIEMAPAMVRLVAHAGRLVLSGIPTALTAEVEHAYLHSGMRRVRSASRGGWAALLLQASW